ncbi:cobalt ABC transporter permease [Inconstantimicrobium mannanitabidum]|uniref:Uncharacterized protein n=1 Tax=Inconstantimicrobium mannanitabidum TaxID=1604901 RepID=A0ACB5R9L5_9CLOT|nr:cobalt ABC transporter permease [Clostridium sp. TW13]GKX65656.1 hypothetical protein rsdtw13_09140 [Clostridium sp. TW13]
MKEFLLTTMLPILVQSIKAALLALIAYAGNEAVLFIRTKKEKVNQEIKSSGHEQDIKAAWEVWNMVEEKFRISDNVDKFVNSKADMFENLLMQKCPWLNKQDIEGLRFAIAGEFNKGKAAVLSSDDAAKQLQAENEKLQIEITNLNSKLNQVQNVVVQSR